MSIVISGDTPGIEVDGSGAVVQVTVTTGAAGAAFDGVHNDIAGRSTANAHPISAITKIIIIFKRKNKDLQYVANHGMPRNDFLEISESQRRESKPGKTPDFPGALPFQNFH